MESNEAAYCNIHGAFYSGYPECPTCAAMESAAQPDAREKPDDWGLGISLKAAPKGDYQLPTPEQRREKRLAEIERIISLRYLRSGNPWGTDTEQLGTCCSCDNCRLVVSQLNEIPELCRELRLSDARVRELEKELDAIRNTLWYARADKAETALRDAPHA